MPRPKKEIKKTSSGGTCVVYYVADAEAGGYTAHIPGLGIVTEGETLREARAMARDAIEGYLEGAKELGQSIPRDVTIERLEVTA